MTLQTLKPAALLRNLQARLDRQALEQLREIAAAQAAQIETLQAELEDTKTQLYHADDAAEFWRDQVFSLEEQLREDPLRAIGMTVTGELLVIEKDEAPHEH